MAKSKLISRIGALALAAALACTSLISASAATIDKATIDMDAKAQLSIYKYDFTNAKKDGVWNERSYVSTGQYDAKVNEVLGGTTRTGANSASSALGNGQASNGYAIKGVEYTYLKIADITQFTESEKDGGRTDSHIEVLYAGYSNYTLRIRYDAKLNSDESLVYGDNGNKNEVVLTWKRTNGTYYDTLIDDAHIYTYATNITKTFSDGKEEQTMFDNVLFKAQNASDGYYVIAQLNEDEGIWYVTGHTDKEASATAMHPVEWNGKKGQIILKGVEDDQYIWTELETANGYTLLKNNIDVTIKSVDDANRPCDIYGKDTLGVIQNDPRYNFPNNEDYKLANIPQKQLAHNYQTASATVDGNDVTMLDDEMDTDSTNAIAPLTVVNTRVFITPMTGDRGTQALAIGGVLVFCLGTSAFIFFLVFKRRKEQEDK